MDDRTFIDPTISRVIKLLLVKSIFKVSSIEIPFQGNFWPVKKKKKKIVGLFSSFTWSLYEVFSIRFNDIEREILFWIQSRQTYFRGNLRVFFVREIVKLPAFSCNHRHIVAETRASGRKRRKEETRIAFSSVEKDKCRNNYPASSAVWCSFRVRPIVLTPRRIFWAQT